MKFSPCFAVGLAIGLTVCTNAIADDKAIAELKEQIEQLELKLNLAEQSLEMVEEENRTLRKENAGLKGEKEEAENEENDQFAVGRVWKGEAKGGKKNAKSVHWAISVSERDGKTFKGFVAAVNHQGEKIEFPVAGTAPASGNGLVVLESPVIGRGRIFMRGRLNNGEIALAYSGVNRLGDKLFGAATLRPK